MSVGSEYRNGKNEWLIRVLIAAASVSIGIGGSGFVLSSKIGDIGRTVAVNTERITLLNEKVDSNVSVMNERIYRLTNLMEELVKQNTVLIAHLESKGLGK